MKVKNEKYQAFLKGELMETITRTEFDELLERVKHPQQDQARCLAILIWMTAARPSEILRLTGKDFVKERSYLIIKIKGSKGGFARPIPLPYKDTLVKEVWGYVKDKFPEMFVFWAFRSSSKKRKATVKIKKKMPDGTIGETVKEYQKEYPNLSNKLIYWFNRWFGIPPYYFRHNRCTLVAEKEDIEKVRLLKGAKSYNSTLRYMHQTARTTKKISKLLVK